ncbi:MAG: alpha/beta hydrolase [Dehalococcoidia bacterium]
MATGIAKANGIDICYETFGNPSDPALLLVMGLGAQMTLWDEAFCELLASRGFNVIRFDNRDTGLSSKIEDGPAPDVAAAMGGDTSSASYTLTDMADDAAGLLTALGIPKAHIVGASMGGMIVQQMAISHPDRILSLCSIMSTTGDRTVGQGTPEALALLMGPAPTTREEAIDAAVKSTKLLLGSGFKFDEAKTRERAAQTYDRMNYPIGFARQLVGIVASGDRTPELRKLNVPTLVIHGEDDQLVTLSGGQATAAAIPGATLLTIPGMGHSTPEGAWPEIVDGIVANAERAAVSA